MLSSPSRSASASGGGLPSEADLAALHAIIPLTQHDPELAWRYARFVRRLRQLRHPRNRTDRRVARDDRHEFEVDLADQLGCDAFYGVANEDVDRFLFAALLAPGEVVVDVGARFGLYALPCARAVGSSGAVYAFEPDPAARELLIDNAHRHGLGARLSVYAERLGKAEAESSAAQAARSDASGAVKRAWADSSDAEQIADVALDRFLPDHGIEAIDGLRIDIPSSSGAVLMGALESLERAADPVVLLAFPGGSGRGAQVRELIQALAPLRERGFAVLSVDPSVPRCRPLADADLGSLAPGCVLIVRRGGRREERLQAILQAAIDGALGTEEVGMTATWPGAPDDTVGGDDHGTFAVSAAPLLKAMAVGALRDLDRMIQELEERMQAHDLPELSAALKAASAHEARADELAEALAASRADGAELREALALSRADGDERLAVVRRLEQRLAEVEARLALVEPESEERLRLLLASQERVSILRANLEDAHDRREREVRDRDGVVVERGRMIDEQQQAIHDLEQAVQDQAREIGRLQDEVARLQAESDVRLAQGRAWQQEVKRLRRRREVTGGDWLRTRLGRQDRGTCG